MASETRPLLCGKSELLAQDGNGQPSRVISNAGAVVQTPTNCWLLTEYLPGGTLSEWIYGMDGRGEAPRRTLIEELEMGLGVARDMLVGISFLISGGVGHRIYLIDPTLWAGV